MIPNVQHMVRNVQNNGPKCLTHDPKCPKQWSEVSNVWSEMSKTWSEMSKNLVRNVPKYGPKCPKIWSEMSGPKRPWSEMSYYPIYISTHCLTLEVFKFTVKPTTSQKYSEIHVRNRLSLLAILSAASSETANRCIINYYNNYN
jgi:hypothetical protein